MCWWSSPSRGSGLTTEGRRLPVRIAGGFSRDAVVQADGSYEIGRLGGNAMWAAAGARLAGARPTAYTVLGAGYPRAFLRELAAAGMDVHARSAPDRRGVWVSYAYDADGTRHNPVPADVLATVPEPDRALIIDTTRIQAEALAAVPTAADLPADNRGTAWHLGLLPVARFHELVDHLAGSATYLQADCPARFELGRDGLGVLGDTLQRLSVFLPSTSDTDVFAPGLSAAELLRSFHGLGADRVVLKCGKDGALVSEQSGPVWQVPAYPTTSVLDDTGAGDAFAGAFAAAIGDGHEPVPAACLAAAVASVAVQYRRPIELATAAVDLPDRVRHVTERMAML